MPHAQRKKVTSWIFVTKVVTNIIVAKMNIEIKTKTLIESCSPGSNSDGSLVQLSDCVVSSPEVAGINRQTLTLVQSLILPILYCTLVGADHLRYGAEELRNAFS